MNQPAGQQQVIQHGMLLALLGSCALHAALMGSWFPRSDTRTGLQETGLQPLHISVMSSDRQSPDKPSTSLSSTPLPAKPTVQNANAQDPLSPKTETSSKPDKPHRTKNLVQVKPSTAIATKAPARPPTPKATRVVSKKPTTAEVAKPSADARRKQTAPTDIREGADHSQSPIDTAIAQKSTDNLSIKVETRRWIKLWLEQEMHKHFRYPGLAKRRNIEGTVTLTLIVQKDGRIEGVEIANSSGHGILDWNARDTLTRIKQVQLGSPLLLSQAMEFTMPVIYRLDRG